MRNFFFAIQKFSRPHVACSNRICRPSTRIRIQSSIQDSSVNIVYRACAIKRASVVASLFSFHRATFAFITTKMVVFPLALVVFLSSDQFVR